jgi:hypothetical protein
MWPLQNLGSQMNEGSSEVTPDAHKLLGSGDKGLQVDDIYFITGLSRRGEVVNLKSQGDGGGMTMEDYISTHYVAGTDKVGSQLPIKQIENLSLKIVILVLTRGGSGATPPIIFFASGNMSHFCLVFHVALIFMSIVGRFFGTWFLRWFSISG